MKRAELLRVALSRVQASPGYHIVPAGAWDQGEHSF